MESGLPLLVVEIFEGRVDVTERRTATPIANWRKLNF